MAERTYSGEDIDKMKEDALKRARQMHSRARYYANGSLTEPQSQNKSDASTAQPKSKGFNHDILKIVGSMGIESDRLIIILLVLALSNDRDNLPLVLALLYIAM